MHVDTQLSRHTLKDSFFFFVPMSEVIPQTCVYVWILSSVLLTR